jgi:hypothetical protein
MKTVNVTIALCGLGILATAGVAANEAMDPPKAAAPPRAAAPQPAPQARNTGTAREIVFTPPRRGAPRTRTGGGTRADGAPIEVAVLVPEDTGLTIAEQPTLYWRLSQDTSAQFEFVLSDDRQVAPLWRESVTNTFRAGIHPLPVSNMKLTLTPGVSYRWFVALVRNPDQRSNDIVSSGTLERVAPAPGLDEQLGRASPEERASIFAAHGLWYDALDALNKMIEAHPDDAGFQAQRSALLKQVGIGGS